MERHSSRVSRSFTCAAAVLAILVSGVSSPCPGAQAQDIVNTLDGIESLHTFAGAVHKGLIGELFREDGPFTIFAPDDTAFMRLSSQAREILFDPCNRDVLDGFLSFHTVDGTIALSAIRDGDEAVALNGEVLDFTVHSGSVFVRGARIVRSNIRCTNGLIHIIDRVVIDGN